MYTVYIHYFHSAIMEKQTKFFLFIHWMFSLNQPGNLLKYFISLKEETTVFLSKYGEEVAAVRMEPSRFGGSLQVLMMKLQSVVSLFSHMLVLQTRQLKMKGMGNLR